MRAGDDDADDVVAVRNRETARALAPVNAVVNSNLEWMLLTPMHSFAATTACLIRIWVGPVTSWE